MLIICICLRVELYLGGTYSGEKNDSWLAIPCLQIQNLELLGDDNPEFAYDLVTRISSLVRG